MKKSKRVQPLNPSGQGFKLDPTPYEYPRDVFKILGELKHVKRVYSKHEKDIGSVYYYNVSCSLDTETSSFYIGEDKCSCMYVWMFSINGKVIVGRTWEEFEDMIRRVHMYTDLNTRLICYVHNLGFDFEYFAPRLKWCKSFCLETHKPIYAITEGGVEFRDSLILTNKGLAASAKDLLKYKVEKKVGDLDYKLVRGSKTPLTPKELDYCIYDCLVLDAVIQEKIEQEGSIAKIPLTNTGYVRRFLKEKCYPGNRHSDRAMKKAARQYRAIMEDLTLTSDEYKMLKAAFAGGYTHANVMYVGEDIKERVDSLDFTSSYPAVILSEAFPMSKAQHLENVSRETFIDILKNKLSVFEITFDNIQPKENIPDHYLSESKCITKGKTVTDNGRIVSSERVSTIITNIDFEIIKNCYNYDSIQVGTVLVYEKGYLPKPIIEGTLELYKGKTTLKGVVGSELEYQIKKGMLNSVYGCMVTDIIKELTEYTNDGWMTTEPDTEEAIDHYNNSRTRFLYYPWGVFVTAYARRNLWQGILEFGEDYIYSDTDSIKCVNFTKHLQFVTWYNTQITEKVKTVLKYYNIDPEEASPKTIKGVAKPIGVWDWETEKFKYKRFKTLGAKRYMYIQDEVDEEGVIHENVLHITIAGLGKKSGAVYLSKKEDPFKYFSDQMNIPEEGTGKNTHTYLGEMEGDFIDYLGNPQHFHEYGGVHLEGAGYSLKLSTRFKEYLEGLREAK